MIELNNGLKLPLIGFGTWKIEESETIETAINVGYKLLDTAIVYENEEAVGTAIINSGIKREDIFVTTKISYGWYDDPKSAYRDSLERLKLDYVDLLLLHSYMSDKRVEAYKALEEIYKEGGCKAIGVSNFTIEHLEELLSQTEIVPAVNQVECHVFYKQKGLREYCKEKGIVLQAYMPFTRGKGNMENPILLDIAKNNGMSVQQVMIRWLIQNDIPTIPKSSNESRMIENLAASENPLSHDDMERINEIPDDKVFCSASFGFEE